MRELTWMPKWLGDPLYPGGLPLSFKNDSWRGSLVEDIRGAYAVWCTYKINGNMGPVPSEHQLMLLIEYAIYYLNAPCWDVGAAQSEVVAEELKRERDYADRMKTLRQLEELTFEVLGLGIDIY